MTIKPTDWVLFTIDRKTYFGEFKHLIKYQQLRLENLHRNWNKSYILLANNIVGFRLHLVVSSEGVKYAEKAHFLFKGLNSSTYSIFNLPGGKYWLDGEMPKYSPVEGLNGILGYEAKKILGLDYLRRLCDHIILPEPKTFKASTPKAYWKKHEDEIKILLIRLRKRSKDMLEERPMKAKQFLVELHGYDKEKKQSLSTKEAIVLKYRDSTFINPKDITDMLTSVYVNVENEWDLTHNILSIDDGSYKIGSGNVDYSEERLRTFSKGSLLELDLTSPESYKFYYKEVVIRKGKEITVTGEEYFRLPKKVDINKVLKFYQKKFPKKNYSLNRNSTKKELSERSKKLEDLPHKGETPAKDLRKVCYKKKDGDMVWRGPFDEVKELVESGNYQFAPKAAWKRQITKKEEGKAEILVKKGEAYKSNITMPLDKGKKLGTRKEKRKEREVRKQMANFRKLQKERQRNGQSKPGDVERKLQSERDKLAYAEKCKAESKKRISHRVSRAFEAVILGDKAEVLATLSIKAKSNDQAEKILSIIVKNKGKEGKLTGNIREWIKQTRNNRPKQSSTKKAGTKKPRTIN